MGGSGPGVGTPVGLLGKLYLVSFVCVMQVCARCQIVTVVVVCSHSVSLRECVHVF